MTAQPAWSVKLLENNIGSAHAIAGASLDELVSVTGAGPVEAAALRERAGAITDAAAMVYARFSRTSNQPALPAVPDLQQVADQLDAYQDVFGPAPLCGCEECGSVLGAGAYLVDLFQFLKTWSKAAWDKLFQLRPDLKGLELTCTNTLTPLPLIDLVNELLEDVAQQQPPTARQTTWSAPDLAANPEYLAFDAYYQATPPGKPPATATFPWTLPFDLALEEARLYLQHLGVSRFEVMRTLASATAPDETTLAIELLGMTAAEWNAIASPAIAASDTDPDPAWGGKSAAQLASVKLFLTQSGLHAADLPPLFSTRFVNPDATPQAGRIGLSIPDDLCNPESSTIVNLHSDGMDRIRRFVRLRRLLGWTFAELDDALAAVASGLLDGPGLLRLARFERIRRQTQLPVAEQLTWWAPLDLRPGANGRSQYDDVYLPRAGISIGTLPGSPSGPDPLALDNSGQPQGAGPGVTLRTFLPRIIAALAVSAADADALLTPDLAASLDSPLSREGLSALYRAVSLSRTASLSPADYGRVRRLSSSLHPFAVDIDSARLFLGLAGRASASALTISEWAFLLHGEAIDSFSFDDASITVLLTGWRTALQSIDAERTASAADPDAVGVVRRKLAKLVKGADLAAAIAFLDEAPGAPLSPLPPPFPLLGLDSTTQTKLTTSPASPPTGTDIRARYELVRTPLLGYLALRDKTSLLIKQAAAAAGITVSLASALAQDPFGIPGGQPLVEVLLGPAIVDPTLKIDPASSSLQAAYQGLRLFGKQALLAGRLRLATGELTAIQAQQASLGWIDWTRFPAQDGDPLLDWERGRGPAAVPRDTRPAAARPPAAVGDVHACGTAGSGHVNPRRLAQPVLRRPGPPHRLGRPSRHGHRRAPAHRAGRHPRPATRRLRYRRPARPPGGRRRSRQPPRPARCYHRRDRWRVARRRHPHAGGRHQGGGPLQAPGRRVALDRQGAARSAAREAARRPARLPHRNPRRLPERE